MVALVVAALLAQFSPEGPPPPPCDGLKEAAEAAEDAYFALAHTPVDEADPVALAAHNSALEGAKEKWNAASEKDANCRYARQRWEGARREREAREFQQKRKAALEAAAGDVRKIPAELRLHHEQVAAEQLEDQQAEAERIARAQSRLEDRQWMKPLLSGLVCLRNAQRKAALEEIAAEKKYSRVGGVENRTKLYELQTIVRAKDDALVAYRGQLAQLGLKALPCSDKLAGTIAACIALLETDQELHPACRTPQIVGALEMVDQL